ncbi:MAG: class F sortase [Candidatus Saccharibacteria bacterium]|nr:class F sortase [Candidatus Saccharibacteria bacterium]
MNLKNKGWRTILKWIATSVLGVLFLVFFLRVVIWENDYYARMEGSERAVPAETEAAEEELIEVEPTEQEVVEYTVAPDRPRYLTIEKLGLYNKRIIAVGVTANQQMGTPSNIFDVGWYDGSGKPGQGGTMMLDGHNGGPTKYGVFKELPKLVAGDIIQVERGDGLIYKYAVVDNVTLSLEDSDKYMNTAAASPEAGKESVTLISCTGEWSVQQKTYLARQFVRAVLVQ